MVSLHKIIDMGRNHKTRFIPGNSYVLTKNGQVAPPEETEKVDRMIWDYVETQGINAVCFDLGEIDDWGGRLSSRVIKKLPFPVCWFELAAEELSIKRGILLSECEDTNGQKTIEGVYLVFELGKWKAQQGFNFSPDQNNSNFQITLFYHLEDKNIDNGMLEFFRVVRYFIDVQSCNNVFLFRNEAPAKLNKKRIKNGKVPIFSYWTLNIDLGKTNNRKGPQGGTHASPRVHLRRGHMREYRPGKFTWIQPMVVGNKKKGVVMKDYKINPPEKRAALS